ncbi:MAG TPA: lysophospholipid acyltransferase family protein [Gemmatimonadales bacterium]|nr:lysophospholipid acyltransferase family protein [Gemmatimonadales bacterium]
MTLRWGPVEPLVQRLAAGLVRLLAATWRYRVRGWEHVARARASGRPIVYVLWHSRILPLLYHRRGEAVALLISRHRDGGYLAELSERWGYRVVRGSSRRGGEVGLLGLVRSLAQGTEVALTPDGPRGPAERMKPGALAAAQHAQALVIATGARATSAWWIRSWDRFLIPKPFAVVEVVYSAPLAVGAGKDALRQGMVAAERALHAVTYGGDPGGEAGAATV